MNKGERNFSTRQPLYLLTRILLTQVFGMWKVQTAEWMDFKVLSTVAGPPLNLNMPPSIGSTLKGAVEALVEEPSITNLFMTSGNVAGSSEQDDDIYAQVYSFSNCLS
jgi:hypothetical protein